MYDKMLGPGVLPIDGYLVLGPQGHNTSLERGRGQENILDLAKLLSRPLLISCVNLGLMFPSSLDLSVNFVRAFHHILSPHPFWCHTFHFLFPFSCFHY